MLCNAGNVVVGPEDNRLTNGMTGQTHFRESSDEREQTEDDKLYTF